MELAREQAIPDRLVSPDAEERIFARAFLSRRVEERLLSLFHEGKLFGTVHTCVGQELTGAVLAEFISDNDTVFSTHRGHGHFISLRNEVDGLISELMGKKSGVCEGWGGSQHLCFKNFFTNGIQGGILPIAAGTALGHKLFKDKNISVVFIGDGTLGEGAVYETFNLASKWELPLLVILENNSYAQSTHSSETLAGDIRARAETFGIRSYSGSTWDWDLLHGTFDLATDYVRKKQKPAFVVVDTYRLKAHSKGDDNRDRREVELFEEKDPLTQRLKKNSVSVKLWDSAGDRVEKAVQKALTDSSPELPTKETTKTVGWETANVPSKRFLAALNEGFHDIMSSDPKVYFIGEDVKSPYGGAFKVSNGLSNAFPGRVLNTPISESAITGLGTGLAMSGFKPIIEIMFGDFLGLCFDQILNHAAKFSQMYRGQVPTGVVIRTPMGGGRGYGPTHSQTLDRHFLGIPGLRVISPSHLTDPAEIYRRVLQTSSAPTLVIENKTLYGKTLGTKFGEGFQLFHSTEMFPTALLEPLAPEIDITLLGYGGIAETLTSLCEELFTQYDIVAQCLIPTQIYPFSIEPYLPQIERAQALLIVEEGQGFAGFGAEIAAQLAEIRRGPKILQRVIPEPFCIPASHTLEQKILPSREKIRDAAMRACRLQ